jgi:hypothetical protein
MTDLLIACQEKGLCGSQMCANRERLTAHVHGHSIRCAKVDIGRQNPATDWCQLHPHLYSNVSHVLSDSMYRVSLRVPEFCLWVGVQLSAGELEHSCLQGRCLQHHCMHMWQF